MSFLCQPLINPDSMVYGLGTSGSNAGIRTAMLGHSADTAGTMMS